MIARLVRASDFERVLRTRSRASSAHFAVHHLADRPASPGKPAIEVIASTAVPQLSTGQEPMVNATVDDLAPEALSTRPGAVWLGAVVPKRHARRAVTRTLLKRQIRAVVSGRSGSLTSGLWVVRLRAPFDRHHFISASSDELKRTARTELEQLLASAAQRVAGR